MKRVKRPDIQGGIRMEIVDLTPDREELLFCCLKPYDEEFAKGVPRRREWQRSFGERGFSAKLAIDDDGEVAGMVQYVPVEHAPHVAGEVGTWVILCIWVHAYQEGLGDRRGRGLGSALLEAAEADMRSRGATGVAAWGLTQPFWMNAPWFEEHGYRRVEDRGWYALTFKAFKEGAIEPRWIVERKRPEPIPGKVRVSSFEPGWCTSGNLIHRWAKDAAAELGEPVLFEEFDTSDPEVVAHWGISTGLFVDGEELTITGDETYEKVLDFIKYHIP
jgi:GNAT superfamily N-acetyltransferase